MFNFMKGVCMSNVDKPRKPKKPSDVIPKDYGMSFSANLAKIEVDRRRRELLDRFAMQAMLLEHNGFTPFDSPEKRKAKSLNCYAIAESMMEARIQHHERSKDKA